MAKSRQRPTKKKYALTPAGKSRCAKCPLVNEKCVHKRCTTEYHSKRPDILFIAEAPGETEDQQGRPVVGRTGLILRRVVKRLNDGTEKGVAYGNIVQCRPPNNREPRPQETEQCQENIRRDISRLRPKQIVLCGRPALFGLALDPRNGMKSAAETMSERPKGKGAMPSQIGMGEARGLDWIVKDSKGREYPAIATWHFAYVARNIRQMGVFKSDIARAFARARDEEEPTDYSSRGKKAVILDTLPKVRKYLQRLKNLGPEDIVAMDYECTDAKRINPHVLTIGLTHRPDRGYVIPWRHPESPWNGREFKKLRRIVKKFFTDPKNGFGALIAHNLKFECAVTKEELGVYLNAFPIEDTLLLAYSLDESRSGGTESRGGKKSKGAGYKLKRLVEEWLGFYHYRDSDIAPTVKYIVTGRSGEVPLRQLSEYNAMDCYATYRLYRACYDMARQEKYAKKLQRLSRHLLGPVSAFTAQMERNGFKLDKDHLRGLLHNDSPVVRRMEYIEKKLRQKKEVQQANKNVRRANKRVGGMVPLFDKGGKASWVFNFRKPEHRIELFVNVMELETPNKSKKVKKPSIDDPFYQKYREEYDTVELGWEWKTLDKLMSTFIQGAHDIIQTDEDMRDGRVRSTYWLYSTDTGRISSSDPNMQQIPSREKHEYTKEIKRMYHADPGNIIVCADYSQAEVRWLAVAAEDKVLSSAFKSVKKIKRAYVKNPTDEALARIAVDGDFHTQTASKVFKKPPDKISKDERGQSKAVVFGIVYGQTKYGLARSIKVSVEEAEMFQEKFLNQFPGVKTHLFSQEHKGFTYGKVESPLGRRRRVTAKLLHGPNVADVARIKDKQIRSLVQHEHNVCRNAPIQSVASDTNLMACVQLQNYIERHNKPWWRIVNIVHDSIIAEVPFEDAEDYMRVVKEIMENPNMFADFGIHLNVPFEADFSVGINWGEQYDVQIYEEWKVVCNKCGKSRKEEGQRPTNRRCEECGSKKTLFLLQAGPAHKLLKKINRLHKISA